MNYCLSCKKKTPNKGGALIKTKKGAWRLESMCGCGMRKVSFVPRGFVTKQKGLGIVDTFIENNPFELHLYGQNEKTGKFEKSAFTGPGTKLAKRLGPDSKPLPHSIPINAVDRGAYEHDLCYRDSLDPRVRNACDAKLKGIADSVYANPNTTFANKAEALVVSKAMSLIKRKV